MFGFWPIMWIVINALWLFNMTDATGSFAVLRRAFARVSDDQRVQVVVIAFCFGALLEALAGFGTPGRHLRDDDGRSRDQADQGRRRGARGRHRAGGLRRDRHPDHHPRHRHRAARPPARSDGGSPDAGAGARGALRARVHDGRPPRPARRLAGGSHRRRRLRAAAVRDLQLRLHRADGHHRLARLGGGHPAAAPRLVAVGPPEPRRGDAPHGSARHRGGQHVGSGVRGAGGQPRPGHHPPRGGQGRRRGAAHPPRDDPRLRALRDHHRRPRPHQPQGHRHPARQGDQ